MTRRSAAFKTKSLKTHSKIRGFGGGSGEEGQLFVYNSAHVYLELMELNISEVAKFC